MFYCDYIPGILLKLRENLGRRISEMFLTRLILDKSSFRIETSKPSNSFASLNHGGSIITGGNIDQVAAGGSCSHAGNQIHGNPWNSVDKNCLKIDLFGRLLPV